MTNSIMWFRRDLRLADNHVLAAAIADARDSDGGVIPLFVVDDALWKAAGANRRWFLAGCLRSLARRSRRPARRPPRRPGRRRSRALARQQGRRRVLPRRRTSGPRPASRRGRRRRARRGRPAQLVEAGQPVRRSGRDVAHEPWRRRSRCSAPTCGRGASSACRRPSAARRIPTVDGVHSDELPAAPAVDADLPEPGEAAAHRALDRFVDRRVDKYAARRDDPGADATEPPVAVPQVRLPHPRQLLRRLDGANRSHETFAKELAWRDFYADVLDAWPESAWRSWNPGDGQHGGRPRTAGRRALRRVVRRPHRLPDRRRRDAPAARRGLDAQPRAHDHRQLPRQGPPRRLDAWRRFLMAHLVDGDSRRTTTGAHERPRSRPRAGRSCVRRSGCLDVGSLFPPRTSRAWSHPAANASYERRSRRDRDCCGVDCDPSLHEPHRR